MLSRWQRSKNAARRHREVTKCTHAGSTCTVPTNELHTISSNMFYLVSVISCCKAVQLGCSKPLKLLAARLLLTLQDSSSTFTPPTAPVTPDTSDPGPYFPVVAIVIIVVAVCVVVLAAVFILLKCLQVRSASLFAGFARQHSAICLKLAMYSCGQVYAITLHSVLKYGCMRFCRMCLHWSTAHAHMCGATVCALLCMCVCVCLLVPEGVRHRYW